MLRSGLISDDLRVKASGFSRTKPHKAPKETKQHPNRARVELPTGPLPKNSSYFHLQADNRQHTRFAGTPINRISRNRASSKAVEQPLAPQTRASGPNWMCLAHFRPRSCPNGWGNYYVKDRAQPDLRSRRRPWPADCTRSMTEVRAPVRQHEVFLKKTSNLASKSRPAPD
jgi:hypothetical protein